MPIERLRDHYDRFARQIAGIMPNWIASEDLRAKFTETISPKFGVHAQAILARLDREGLWPSP